jgi:hypothetical protein
VRRRAGRAGKTDEKEGGVEDGARVSKCGGVSEGVRVEADEGAAEQRPTDVNHGVDEPPRRLRVAKPGPRNKDEPVKQVEDGYNGVKSDVGDKLETGWVPQGAKQDVVDDCDNEDIDGDGCSLAARVRKAPERWKSEPVATTATSVLVVTVK